MRWHFADGATRRQVILFVAIMAAAINGISAFEHALQSQVSQADEAVPPLIEAIWTQDVERLRRLLADGADPESKTTISVVGRDRPAWGWAITAREDTAAALLLSKVRSVDRVEGLLVAAIRNDVPLTRTLLDKGMPVDARGIDGATALLAAAASGHVDTIRLLIQRGASVNLADLHRDTPLMAAVRAGSIESVKLLLAGGADVNARDRTGRAAFTWADRSRRKDVMDTLRASGGQGETREPRTLLTAQAAVARSLPLIQQGIATWDERQSCVPCHHHPLMLRVAAVAQRQGFAMNPQLLAGQTTRIQRFFTGRENRVKTALESDAGVLRWSLQTGGDTTFGGAQFLSSFAEAGLKWPSLQNETLLLARMQLRDGRWRYAPPRSPIMSSDFTATAEAVRALQVFGSTDHAEELNARIRLATTWLRTTPPETTDDKVFRLFGLDWTNSDAALVSAAATSLRNEQNPDGGWSQLRGLNSDAYATGQVLVALYEAGGLRGNDPVYQRGVKYLLETQESDGSWLVPKRAVAINGYFESGFPHGKFQFISYAGTCWATIALMYTAEGPRQH